MGLKIVSWNCHYGLDNTKLKVLLNAADFGKNVSLFAFQEILENEYIDIADCDEAAKYKYRHWYGDHQEIRRLPCSERCGRRPWNCLDVMRVQNAPF